MSALCLTTTFRQDAYEGEACLLVYDEYEFTESTLSEDVRNIFDRRPATANIYVLAPFESEAELVDLIAKGVAVERARRYFDGIGGRVRLLGIKDTTDGQRHVSATPFEYSEGKVHAGEPEPLDDLLRSGWLFDLFHRGGGLVEAPAGVHFGKVSGRHSNKFLRASGPLLTSEACAAVAFFALGETSGKPPSRIFVDTAPIIAVAFAMARIAVVHELWDRHPPVKSFSSYGGVENLPRTKPTDLFLISASTSGGLANRLVGLNGDESRIVTLFYLESGAPKHEGTVVCHLTYRNKGLFGYPAVTNYPAQTCPFCKDGYFLAQLEGDQFLLEQRAIKRLAVRSKSQPDDARNIAERLARTSCLDVTLFKSSARLAGVNVNGELLLDVDAQLRADFIRMLRRFTPTPLNYVVRVGLSETKFRELIKEAGLDGAIASATVTDDPEGLASIPNGTALVVFGCLSNHAQARGINARMRTLVPGGAVAYLSAITVAETSHALNELNMFLSFGERGRDTFTFRSALQFMLPVPTTIDTSWEAERNTLLRIKEKKELEPELGVRLDDLEASAIGKDSLFFSGCRPRLEIARDFVYLDTNDSRELITQADIFAVVTNTLACVRADNQGLSGGTARTAGLTTWASNVYGHVLICPSNFEIYNDAILRAAFLRAASPTELLYSVDEECSTAMLNVILAEAYAWDEGGGSALPEFLLALAAGRMRLTSKHSEELCARLKDRKLPNYLRDLAHEIEASQHY
ncbi:hypothetical protein [Cupriavidus metallidurans]|uniref:hypothetical protein n=1 Tax=Cupriavidus metallidurans TaxID=119219 RepID=UPI0016460F07|nr:hypothetical protein [Cupriavidus metallidurans]